MSFNLIYRRLFRVGLWHDFFFPAGSDPAPGDLPFERDFQWQQLLEVVPSAPTEALIRKFRLRFRIEDHGFSLYAQATEAAGGVYHTLIPLDQNLRFTFFLRLKNRHFVNYTLLKLAQASGKVYYFSNKAGNDNPHLFLSRPLPAYSGAAVEYRLEDLVVHDDGGGEAVFEAITNFTSAPGTEPSEPTPPSYNEYWEKSPFSQYVSAQDRLPLKTPLFTYREDSYATHEELVTFELRDEAGNVLDLDAGWTSPQSTARTPAAPSNPGDPIDPFIHTLNLSKFPPGKYELLVRGTPYQEFFLLDPLAYGQVFGVVECVHEIPPGGIDAAYQFIDNTPDDEGKLQSIITEKNYVIRFKNRSTRWRYFFPDDPPPADIDATRFDGADGVYTTLRPRGLSRYFSDLYLDASQTIRLPDPRPEIILPERDTSFPEEVIKDIFSEIYLSVNP